MNGGADERAGNVSVYLTPEDKIFLKENKLSPTVVLRDAIRLKRLDVVEVKKDESRKEKKQKIAFNSQQLIVIILGMLIFMLIPRSANIYTLAVTYSLGVSFVAYGVINLIRGRKK